MSLSLNKKIVNFFISLFITFSFFSPLSVFSYSGELNSSISSDYYGSTFQKFKIDSSASSNGNCLIAYIIYNPRYTDYPDVREHSVSYYYSTSPISFSYDKTVGSYGLSVSGSNITKYTYSYNLVTGDFSRILECGSSVSLAEVCVSSDIAFIGNVTCSNDSSFLPSFDAGNLDSDFSDNDIVDFNWFGNGVKIYRPSDKQEISGYQTGSSSMKWFDSVVYGKMTVDKEALPVYVGTSITLKSLKTTIQNSTIGRIGNETRRAGEGLGIKNFEWVDSPSSIKQGDVLKFKMTIQMPMLEMGVHDFTVGVSMPTTKNYEYFSDTKKDINFLIDNKDDNFYEPPPSGGSSGEVNGSDNDYSDNGSSSGGSNDSMGDFPDSDNYEDTILGKLAYFRDLCLWLILYPFNFLISAFDTLTGYIKQMVNILSPFSAEMDKLFSFIPEDIRKVCWGSLSMMLLYSLVKGVSRLFRGR